ncbi:adaptin N terminal region-domain-containing protein [Aspergillus ambiguus]|uniref:putative AP-3 complex subunit delta n=1 Tax=Aspergillus ambiguus TaxID=176160 RepID=UPI003CCE2E67
MSLPLITLPNIITHSLAMSLLQDVLSRISHSHAAVRKKAVVCLYRLSLVYPEALKLAWPKLKDRLMDNEEDGSVTTAVINVVCELGWRRPHDFLPLAPRFFELLVDSGNNWMAIKIIKLFATLTPLEPRLIRKLLRPLMNIIQSTTAMSLLYECINGIIQGGILDADGVVEEKEEIATLCVGKLRGMVVTDSDPNLKYVALLAFNRIVVSYPFLVSVHQDVIMDCLEDPDISIRLQALELAVRMVTSDTLESIVHRLLSQLHYTRLHSDRHRTGISLAESMDEEDPEIPTQVNNSRSTILPYNYRIEILHRILDICSSSNYSELPDFEWYVDILVQLVKLLPSDGADAPVTSGTYQYENEQRESIAYRIGSELRNVAVRVRDVRPEATRAAESLIVRDNADVVFPSMSGSNGTILGPIAWIVGEYAEYLFTPDRTLQSLMDLSGIAVSATTTSLCLQALPKVFVQLITSNGQDWNLQRKGELSLLLSRIIETLESLASHPDLDVQERATEFLEVMRLAADAVQSQAHGVDQMPLLLTSALPSLFYGLELNPVSVNAQKKVPLPEQISLDDPFSGNLRVLFTDHENVASVLDTQVRLQDFYYTKEPLISSKPVEPIQLDIQPDSYQNLADGFIDDGAAAARRKAGRRERNRDDPFYIGVEEGDSGTSTPFHQAFTAANGSELDIDSIPIIDLKLNDVESYRKPSPLSQENRRAVKSRPKKYNIIADEMIGQDETGNLETSGEPSKAKRSLLEVDSSGLGRLSLKEDAESSQTSGAFRNAGHDTEMALAMQEVERARLEMQRASERVHAKDIPAEGTLVKKKRRVKKPKDNGPQNTGTLSAADDTEQQPPVSVSKKKRRKQTTP